MGRVIGWSWMVVWLGCLTVSAAQLPPDVLLDKYLLQATMLSEEKDHKGALEAMDRIVALQEEHNLTLPEDFPYRYAQTALAAGSVQAAVDSANRYLTAAGKEGKYYREALELLVKAERKLAEPTPDPVAPTPVKPDLEPQRRAGPTTPPQVQKTTAAQPAVDCRKWNTKKFFRKATVEEVTACVNAGVELDARDGSGWSDCAKCTPLHRAALYNENGEVVQALINAGAKVDARNGFFDTCSECTPLQAAVMYNESVEVVEVLLAAGADPNARDRAGFTSLHRAAWHNQDPSVVERLLAAGADLESRDGGDWSGCRMCTPLHRAAMSNKNPEVVEALLAAGADQMSESKKGKTPLQVASKRNRRVLRSAWAGLSDRQKAAYQAQVRSRKVSSGPSFLDVAVGVAGGAAIAAAGEGSEEAVEAGTVFAESVISGGQPATRSGGASVPPTGQSSAAAVSGPCQVSGYPNPPGGVANLGFSWCPASVDLQVRAFALQAAGAQCAMATGSSSTPEQIEARRNEIRAACDRLAALGQGNCQCPPELRQ